MKRESFLWCGGSSYLPDAIHLDVVIYCITVSVIFQTGGRWYSFRDPRAACQCTKPAHADISFSGAPDSVLSVGGGGGMNALVGE